ncbi:hypothetical protein [Anaerophaga thermohalophila]|uniref:hypothetical protein n=1 Tax=Anaerophaga thermohalophila TaxID=177400 RepID=UPI000305CC23|nr:hypothetical protein [Anaerophaga thermohalophila]
MGVSVFDGAYSLVVYESAVYSDHAEFNAFLTITNPLDGKKIRFHASDVTYSFSGGISSFRLELTESIKTNLFKHASLIWKTGTYAQWDCDGFNHIGLNARLELDSENFVQVNPFTGEETGSIQNDFFITLKDINNFVFDISIPTFKIRGFDEAYFEFNHAVLDCSDSRNAPAFQLPKDYPGGYEGEMAKLWRGVYANEAKVYLSKKFQNKNSYAPVSFAAKGLFIDDFGFTGVIEARNVLSIGDGNIGSWPFSIDEFSLGFFVRFLSGIRAQRRCKTAWNRLSP